MYNSGEFRAESPVMTFRADGVWLAVSIEQMNAVTLAEQLWPVPLSGQRHVGLLDSGESLVPVMHLGEDGAPEKSAPKDQLVAILRARDEAIGIAIDRAGQVETRYWRVPDSEVHSSGPLPAFLERAHPERISTTTGQYWLLDTERLWPISPSSTEGSQRWHTNCS